MVSQPPKELLQKYRGDRHIQRLPFVINPSVDEGLLGEFRGRAIPENAAAFMIAGFRALNILANAGANTKSDIKHTVLFDTNMAQIKTTHMVLRLIDQMEKPEDFIKYYSPIHLSTTNRIPRQGHETQSTEDQNFFAVRGAYHIPRTKEDLEDYFERQLSNPLSWLYPENYARIRSKVQNNEISTAILDLSDKERIGTLQNWLAENDLKTALMYISTIPGFILMNIGYFGSSQANCTDMLDNMAGLLNENSIVLASQPVESRGSGYSFRMIDMTKNDLLQLKDIALENQEPGFSHVFSYGTHPIILMSQNENSYFLLVEHNGKIPFGFTEAFISALDNLDYHLDDCYGNSVSFRVPQDERKEALPGKIEAEVKTILGRMGIETGALR